MRAPYIIPGDNGRITRVGHGTCAVDDKKKSGKKTQIKIKRNNKIRTQSRFLYRTSGPYLGEGHGWARVQG